MVAVGESEWSRASFASSLIPMVLADDERRYVAVNQAACLFLRLPEEEVLKLRIEDLAAPENRVHVEPLWRDFIQQGVQEGVFDLLMPDGGSVRVEYSASANVEPGRHLAIWVFPPSDWQGEPEPRHERRVLLTAREREVLAMVAMGRGTSYIAAALGVSSSTIETHVRNCLEKLGARNRAHAIALGLHAGEIGLELNAPPPPGNWG